MLPTVAHLEQLLEPAIAGLGFELVDLQWVQLGGRNTLRLRIDKRDGGIKVADCTAVSRAVSPLLDVESTIGGRYDLEVSSPGLDRPLRKPADFDRFQGRVIEVRTQAPVDGQKNFKGTLDLFDGTTVFVNENDRVVNIPFDQIERARLAIQVPQANGPKQVKQH